MLYQFEIEHLALSTFESLQKTLTEISYGGFNALSFCKSDRFKSTLQRYPDNSWGQCAAERDNR